MRSVLLSITAIALALFIGALILWASGASPLLAYWALLKGAFGDAQALQRTLEKATPLVFSGLAVAFAFKASLFNIGTQGQLLLGAIIAAAVGFGVSGLPPYIHAPLALLAGAAAGAAFAAIAGVLKVYTGAHEVITTIMLNYIAINLTDYLADGPWKDRSPMNIVARTPAILDSARLPTWGPIPSGFVIAVLLAGVIYWILWKTTFGFEIRTVGQNRHAARYAGISVAKVMIATMVISGLLAGLGGAVETQGVVGRYQPGFNVGLGFEGITIALLAKTHPFGVVPAALLVGAMKAGSSQMQFTADVAKEIIDVIQALMLFFISAEFLLRRLLGLKEEAGEEKLVLSTGWGSGD
ncbi:MAG: ABC transporter permease [Chloroflexi bacterium]|nr:ABC transporter permease [Chloroflexota bacterium]